MRSARNLFENEKKMKKKRTKSVFPSWQSRIISNTKQRQRLKYNEELEITKNDLNKLVQEQRQQCYFTNIEFDLTMENKLLAPSLDRINNDKKYTLDNVRLVIQFINIGRNTATEEETRNVIKLIIQHARVSKKLKKPIHEYNVRNYRSS